MVAHLSVVGTRLLVEAASKSNEGYRYLRLHPTLFGSPSPRERELAWCLSTEPITEPILDLQDFFPRYFALVPLLLLVHLRCRLRLYPVPAKVVHLYWASLRS